MSPLFGQAAITWAATSEGVSERILLLEAPLRSLRLEHSATVFQRRSLDRSVVENVMIDGGAPELVGKIRYDKNAQQIADMLVAGSAGKTLRYIPNRTDPAQSYLCDLLSPLLPAGARPDAQRNLLGEYEIELRLVQTTQAPFGPIQEETEALFTWRVGDSLEQATFANNTTEETYYVTVDPTSEDYGAGTLTQATSGVARIEWWSTDPAGVRTEPILRLEHDAENHCFESNDFNTSWVADSNSLASTGDFGAGIPSPTGSSDGWILRQTGAATTGNRYQRLAVTGLPSTARLILSAHIAPGSCAAPCTTEAQLAFAGGNGASYDMRVNIEWTTDAAAPVLTYVNGSSFVDPQRLRNGYWRIAVESSSTNAGVSSSGDILVSGGAVTNDETLFYGIQLESSG